MPFYTCGLSRTTVTASDGQINQLQVVGSQDSEQSAFASRVSCFEHIFETNIPPTDLEREEIRLLLRDVQKAISKPKHQTTKKDNDLTSLKTIRSNCKTALSLVRRLPGEIISEIFSHNIPQYPRGSDLVSQTTLDTLHTRWTLLKVSRRWRTIALNHQPIWSFISVDFLHRTDILRSATWKRYKSKLRFCLERSGAHDLFIYFQDASTRNDLGTMLFRVLVAHSHRWRNVTLLTHFENLELAARVRENLPRLHYLRLCGYGLPQNRIIDAFEVAPELREVCLDTADPFKFILPWSQLTALSGWIADIDILNHVPQLESCGIRIFIRKLANEAAASRPLTLRHPKLRRLNTATINYSSTISGLTTLILPALEDLCINHITSQASSKLDDIMLLVNKSLCSLRSLTMAYTMITDPTATKLLLHCCPYLERLKIVHGYVNWDMIIDLLTVKNDSCLIPRLKRITFTVGRTGPNNSYPRFDPLCLVRMVESRWHEEARGSKVPRLESLTLRELPRRIPEHLMERIRELQARGLKVTIAD